MAYRSYNSIYSELLESTPFESKEDNLFTFLGQIKAKGGYYIDAQAVEVCLQAVNKFDDVSQVILVGDAGYNPLHVINSLRE